MLMMTNIIIKLYMHLLNINNSKNNCFTIVT